MEEQNEKRKLVWSTLLGFIAIGAFVLLLNQRTPLPQLEINTHGQPTIGNPLAQIHVVVFEEPKCTYCKKFSTEVFPKIKENYIANDKIRYTVIPVSFLPGSMPAAAALLCSYLQESSAPNDELFFTFLNFMYKNQPEESSDWATTDTLTQMAKAASPAINIAKLKRCLEFDSLRPQVEKNTVMGNQLMGHLVTPTIFVNGIKANRNTFEEVSKLINLSLSQQALAQHAYNILESIPYLGHELHIQADAITSQMMHRKRQEVIGEKL